VQIETNFLLNPQHPEFSKIRIGSAEAIAHDPRLIKKGGYPLDASTLCI
jgi:hypothetical protein